MQEQQIVFILILSPICRNVKWINYEQTAKTLVRLSVFRRNTTEKRQKDVNISMMTKITIAFLLFLLYHINRVRKMQKNKNEKNMDIEV